MPEKQTRTLAEYWETIRSIGRVLGEYPEAESIPEGVGRVPEEGEGVSTWAAAGMKKPVKDVGGWTCGVCMVPNEAGVEKCVACDSDRA